MKICIDAMGGDNAPVAVFEGVKAVLGKLDPATELRLYGTGEAKALAESMGILSERVGFVVTTEVIGCDESPTMAIRTKKDSSIVRALQDIAAGNGDAIVSAGSTGAVLTGATLIVKRLPGIKRPALAAAIPNVVGGRVLLLDSGANTDCKPEYLVQFAIMGKAYMEKVQGVPSPKIGLLNNGAEAEKGNELTKTVYGKLLEAPIDFAGNCEAREALSGDFDVIVADGFDGNVLLKSIEGTASAMMTMLKRELYGSLRTKIGAVIAKPAFRNLKKVLDYTEEGGAPLLGVRAGVVKAHGSSNAKAFAATFLQAERLVANNVTGVIAEALKDLAEE
ncbi:MAG: phosphate acyltransferase PlsX [Clostridia bacterium]|nr:phosphate acyltransferase PlsX [Clostridia bacterium]